METKKMKMEYRRHLDNEGAPWQLVTNIDELMWNGEYFIRVSNDDGSSQLPFPLNNDETATLVVKDYSHEGKLQRNRKIVQEISKVERDGGKVLNYSRVYHEIYGKNQWGSWEQETNREGTSTDDNKEEYKIQWTSSSYLDTYTTAGIYDITGERTNDADGLPLANAAPGHTFHARLLVLDSSIAGSGKDTDKCITQILSLSNRTGGDGNVYTRTGRAASKNLLAGGSGWGPWGKLQQNVEVGQVTSLDSFTDNGIYSGVYTGGDTHVENFVMIVINNYAVAAETGNIRSISQYKHALNIDGTFSHKTRTGQGNTGISWGSWVDLGAATTTDIQDGAITAQKLSTDVREKVENPLRPLYIAAGAKFNVTGSDKIEKDYTFNRDIIHKAGHYYLNGLGDITEEEMNTIYAVGKIQTYNATGRFRAKARTTLASTINGSEGRGLLNFYYLCSGNSIIETFDVVDERYIDNILNIEDMSMAFSGCSNLTYIYNILNVSSITSASKFSTFSCPKLIEIRVKGLKVNFGLAVCTEISQKSVLFAIQSALPTSAITITLHPDAYARLADDADIVAALEAQPLVSLVCA